MRLAASIILALLLCFNGGAATILFDISDFTSTPSAYRTLKMSPTTTPSVSGTNIIVSDTRSQITTTYGRLYFSNVVAGTYQCTFTGPNITTTFQITVTNSSALINAKDIITVSTNSVAGLNAYSMASSDARYLSVVYTNGVAIGTNPILDLIVGTNIVVEGTNTSGRTKVYIAGQPGGGGGGGSGEVTYAQLAGSNYVNRVELQGSNYTTQAGITASNFVNRTELNGSNYVNRTELNGSNYTTRAQIAGSNFVAVANGVQGDVVYHNGTLWTRLPAGTSGQFFQTLGAGANPQWATPAGSGAGFPLSADGNAGGFKITNLSRLHLNAGAITATPTNLTGTIPDFLMLGHSVATFTPTNTAMVNVVTPTGADWIWPPKLFSIISTGSHLVTFSNAVADTPLLLLSGTTNRFGIYYDGITNRVYSWQESNYVTFPILAGSNYATFSNIQGSNYVTRGEVSGSNFVTFTILNGSNYVNRTELNGSNYVARAELAGSNYTTFANIQASNFVTYSILNGSNYVARAELAGSNYTTFANIQGSNYVTQSGIAASNIWDSFTIAAGAWTPSATNPATAVTNMTGGTDYVTQDAWEFDDTTLQSVEVSFQMPMGWNLGDIRFEVWGSSTNTIGTNIYALKAKSVAASEDPSAAWGSEAQHSAAGGAVSSTAGRPFNTPTTAVTIGGTPAAGEWVLAKLSRKPADISDNLVGKSRMWAVVIHYQKLLIGASTP